MALAPRAIMAEPSPSQTLGPFFHDAIMRTPYRAQLVSLDSRLGEVIRIQGRIRREGGRLVDDALIELWQAGPDGAYAGTASHASDAAFGGFGRAASNGAGEFEFVTLRPGVVSTPDGSLQAPHVNIHLLGRGLMDRIATRIFFPESLDDTPDPVLSVIDPARRHTLIAEHVDDVPVPTYRVDLLLRGEGETVFFAS